MIVVADPEPLSREGLRGAAGSASVAVADLDTARRRIDEDESVTVLVLGPNLDLGAALALCETLRLAKPLVGVVLVRPRVDAAMLTDALRAGVREVVKERDVDGVVAAVRRAVQLSNAVREQAGLLAGGDPERRGRVVTVFSAKGGAGKTTLATNLAAALADRGRREVCLVDLDLAFGDVAIALQLFPSHTLGDAVPMMDTLDTPALAALLTPHSPGLTTLVAPVEPGSAESVPAALVTRVLGLLRRMFDYVVVDTPPAFTDHVLAAFDESDRVALLATLDIPSLKNLKLTLETLDLLSFPRDRWRVVLNRADSKVGLSVGEVEKTLHVAIAAQIPSSRAVPASINRGVPIVLDDPGHAVSAAIRAFAEKEIAVAAPASSLPASMRTDNRRFGLRRKERSS